MVESYTSLYIYYGFHELIISIIKCTWLSISPCSLHQAMSHNKLCLCVNVFNTIQMNIKGTKSKNVGSKFSKLRVAHHGFLCDFEGTGY